MKNLFLVLLLSLAFVAPSYGQTADSVIALNIKARGGLTRLEKISSVKMEGVTTLQDLQAPFTILLKRPNKMRLEVLIHNDTLVQAYNGNIAWTILPTPNGNQLRKLSSLQANDLKHQADIDGPLIHYKQKGYTVQYGGISEINHHKTYKLRLTGKNGDMTSLYIDTRSHFTISETSIKKIRTNVASPLPDKILRVTTYFDDYREVEGVALPFKIETLVDGEKISNMDIDTITLNVGVPNHIFDYPASTSN